jgi:hypothetical protein
MKLIRVRDIVAAADVVRNRLYGRPFVNRPNSDSNARRS